MRLDLALVARGLIETRAKARAAIEAGRVCVDGECVTKPSRMVSDLAFVSAEPAHPWVSRGGVKLEAALERFAVSAADRSAIDVGASTGGFTQVLLARGARHVTAVDTGTGQMHPRLRDDPRVTLLEQTDVRTLAGSPPVSAFDLVVVDVSFISLVVILPSLTALSAAGTDLIGLVKPQFEVGRSAIGKGGIVRDEAARREALDTVLSTAAANGWTIGGTMESPITGGDGNIEYLIHAGRKVG